MFSFLMSTISSLFGYVLNFIYNIVNSFGVSIIIFSILLKLVLLPVSIKQQKTMKKTAKIQVKIKELQEKYKNDQQKMNQEMMDLYKKENMSPFSGCLSAILPIFLLIAMFGLARNPLTYMLKIDENTVKDVANYMRHENIKVNQSYPQISILKYVSQNRGKVIDLSVLDEEEKTDETSKQEGTEQTEPQNDQQIEVVEENNNTNEQEKSVEPRLVNLDDLYINMEFLGLDLSNIPKENSEDKTVFIIPILYVITSVASMKITTMMTKNNNKNNNDKVNTQNKENEKDKEPSSEEMAEQMNKSMTWFMPLLAVSISLVAPLGLALYWLLNNILMIVERLVLNKLIKSDEEEQNGKEDNFSRQDN